MDLLHLIDLPVYSVTEEAFYQEREHDLEAHLDSVFSSSGAAREDAPHTYSVAEEYFLREYGNWRFTQSIGWIRIYVLGTQIRGEAWVLDAKRARRDLKHRRYVMYGKCFELGFLPQDSSEEIFSQLKDELRLLEDESPFKRRHIDAETLENLGLYVDWHAVVFRSRDTAQAQSA